MAFGCLFVAICNVMNDAVDNDHHRKRNRMSLTFTVLSGVLGPMVIDEIEKYTRESNRSDDVHCLKISHIGS